MKNPYVDFKALKAAVTIRRILEHYNLGESLQERGDRVSGPCPVCRGESSSFRVSLEKNCFKCFRCEAGGNILDFVAAMEDCPIREAAVRIAGWFGIETARPPRQRSRKEPETGKSAEQQPEPEAKPAGEATAPCPEPGHATPAGKEAPEPSGPNPPLSFELKLDPDHPWFGQAGLLPETVEEFGLGFCSKGLMANRIVFPLRNAEGKVIGYAGRWPADEVPEGQALWKYPKELNLGALIYPEEKLAGIDPSRVLLAPDPLQVVRTRQMGLTDVLFVPSGKLADDALTARSI